MAELNTNTNDDPFSHAVAKALNVLYERTPGGFQAAGVLEAVDDGKWDKVEKMLPVAIAAAYSERNQKARQWLETAQALVDIGCCKDPTSDQVNRSLTTLESIGGLYELQLGRVPGAEARAAVLKTMHAGVLAGIGNSQEAATKVIEAGDLFEEFRIKLEGGTFSSLNNPVGDLSVEGWEAWFNKTLPFQEMAKWLNV